jgi:hypothetical protein
MSVFQTMTQLLSLLLYSSDREPERAHRAWETHLARRWMTTTGYRIFFKAARRTDFAGS